MLDRLFSSSTIFFADTSSAVEPSRHLLARLQAISIIQDLDIRRIFTGVGQGGFSLFSIDGYSFPYSFNTWLTICVESGALGASLLLALFFKYFRLLYISSNSDNLVLPLMRNYFSFILLSFSFYELKAFLPSAFILGLMPYILNNHANKDTDTCNSLSTHYVP